MRGDGFACGVCLDAALQQAILQNIDLFVLKNHPTSCKSAPLRAFLPVDLHACCRANRVAELPQSPLQNQSQALQMVLIFR